jgi:hypothetical protein
MQLICTYLKRRRRCPTKLPRSIPHDGRAHRRRRRAAASHLKPTKNAADLAASRRASGRGKWRFPHAESTGRERGVPGAVTKPLTSRSWVGLNKHKVSSLPPRRCESCAIPDLVRKSQCQCGRQIRLPAVDFGKCLYLSAAVAGRVLMAV